MSYTHRFIDQRPIFVAESSYPNLKFHLLASYNYSDSIKIFSFSKNLKQTSKNFGTNHVTPTTLKIFLGFLKLLNIYHFTIKKNFKTFIFTTGNIKSLIFHIFNSSKNPFFKYRISSFLSAQRNKK